MRLPDQRVLALHQLEHILGATGVIDFAILRMLFHEQLTVGTRVRPINRLWKSDVVMPAEIKVNGHALPGAGRRVVERENPVYPGRIVTFLAVGVPDTDGKSFVAVLSIPDLVQVHLQFSRKEKLVRWRE